MSETGKETGADYDALFEEAEQAIDAKKEGEDVLVEVEDEAEEDSATGADDQVAELEKTNRELQDRLLRQAADFENFRKRSRKEQDDARNKAKEDVLKEILPVIDNLDRALEAADSASASVESIVQGVNMVLRQFETTMERLGAKVFDSKGEPFDPSRHEAIAQIETNEVPPGTVFAEMQKGYFVGSRLLRPALVSVAKAASEPEDNE